MILLKNVSKSYRNGVHALRDINLEVEDGEFVYIIGPVSYTHLDVYKRQAMMRYKRH